MRKELSLSLAGISLTGAFMGLAHGGKDMATTALLFPMIAVGIPLLTLPALYIAAAYVGAAPEPRTLISSSVAGLRTAGFLLLGMLPALVFLLATATQPSTCITLTGIVAAAGAMLGIQSMFTHTAAPSPRFAVVFCLWAAVTMGIGSRASRGR